MTGGAAQVYQSAFCEQENFVSIRERVLVDLRFDVGPLHALRGVAPNAAAREPLDMLERLVASATGAATEPAAAAT